MSGIHKLTIFTCADTVTAADFIDIDFSAAGFLNPPVVVATVDDNINTFISQLCPHLTYHFVLIHHDNMLSQIFCYHLAKNQH